MKTKIFFLFTLVLTMGMADAMEIISPNKQIKIVTELRKEPGNSLYKVYYKVLYSRNGNKYIEVLPFSQLGINREDQDFYDNLQLVKEGNSVLIQDSYKMIHGKREECGNQAIENTLYLKNSSGELLNITFRAYNNGVAFRYSFPIESNEKYRIIDESTSFVIPAGTKRWMQPFTPAYEDYYLFNADGKSTKKSQEWGFPALYQMKGNDIFVLITEANILRNNCATKLSNIQKAEEYRISMPNIVDKAGMGEFPKEYNMSGVFTSFPWHSQWRVLMIGALSDIAESTLVTDLSEPSKIVEASWIEPGVASWDWWYNNTGGRDYKIILKYIDLAKEMKWQYMLVDAGWDSMENGGNLEDVVTYAKSKGVKILVWYNSSTIERIKHTPKNKLLTSETRTREFAWLKNIGVSGIKVDFFAGDQQDVMNYYIDLLEDAAKYNLHVNFHGATVPRGWQRTYPNLMTVEGVFGAEMYGFRETLTREAPKHNAILPFTRNVIGPMDYTPVTFTNLKHSHNTSYAHELALSVVFESGIQHFADTPEAYLGLPDAPKNFLTAMPVAWDDTKLIDGYPGEKAIFARKKDDKWFIGGINGLDKPSTLSVNLDFLDNGKYKFELIQDGESKTSFQSKKIKVRKGQIIEVPCLPAGGFAGIISK